MEKDIIVSCPYDKTHRIRQYKLMSHIIKCRKQRDTTHKVTCPLNSSHIIDHSDIKNHLSSCSNLSSLIQNSAEEKIDITPSVDVDTYKSVENWDEAPEVPTYDPIASTSTKKVIRCVNGLTKSKRLQYRLSERERIANLNGASSTVVSRAQPLHKDTIYEITMRPPYDIAHTEDSTKVNQQKSNQEAQEEESCASLITSTTTNEFHDTFQNTLYNESPPDYKPDHSCEDSTFAINDSQYVKIKDSVRMNNILQRSWNYSTVSNDTSYKSNYLSLSLDSSAKNHTEVSEKENGMSGASSSKKDIEHIKNTRDPNTSSHQVTDKLLTLLAEKMKLVGEMKENDDRVEKYKKREEEKHFNSKWENLIYKLSDRLDHLTNAQSAAAEQSARLAKEVSDLKQLKNCCNNQSTAILNNPRCAANFTEMSLLKPSHSKNYNVSRKAPWFFENVPSYDKASKVIDKFDLKDNSESPKLKTPEDFSQL